MRRASVWSVAFGALVLASGCGNKDSAPAGDGTAPEAQEAEAPPSRGGKAMPLRVMLVPADGGTEQGTRADYEPIFNAIARSDGLHFDIKVGQSYNAVVEAMAGGKIEIAFFGPVTYHQARQRGVAELLAVAVRDGQSIYYSGIFVNKASGITRLEDLKGKGVAFGDVNSTSSFNFPIAMLLDVGLDPIADLGRIDITGSHANSLSALGASKVDAACASYTSFEKAVKNGQLDPEEVVPLARSEPIPYPPLAMHTSLDPALKKTLKAAFAKVHTQPGVTPDMIRGYGGKKVDRYDSEYPEAEFDKAMSKLARVTDDLKAELLKKAAQ